MVSSTSLARSARVHKAFCYLYLPFYHLPIECFFEHFGTFVYVEALVYEADSNNEIPGSRRLCAQTLSKLSQYLSERRLLDSPCRQQLNAAIQYFRVERKVLRGIEPSLSETLITAAKRSFDFKLLHRILFQLNGWTYDEEIFRRFAAFEEVLEFDDDCLSRTEDRHAGTFNVINRLAAYGSQAIERYYETLLKMVRSAEREVGRSYSCLIEQYVKFVPSSILAASAAERLGDLIVSSRTASDVSVRTHRAEQVTRGTDGLKLYAKA
jgi:hypothetical protein